MINRLYFCKIISLLSTMLVCLPNLMAVDVDVRKFCQSSDVSWSITNELGHVEYLSDDFASTDTCFMELDDEKTYYFNTNVTNFSIEDTAMFLLSINGSGVLLVNNEQVLGEVSYPFYTGVKSPQLKIVGGNQVDISEVPWQIYLQFGAYMCGGSIISDRWIVTAAHCTQDSRGRSISANEMFIVAGATNPYDGNSGGQYNVKSYVIHQSYNSNTLENDIALLELERDIDEENASPIQLLSEQDILDGAIDPGTMSSVTGWGITSVTPQVFPEYLQTVDVPIVSNELASEVWYSIPSSVLMAGYKNGGKDACSGDSGGPLVVDVSGVDKLAGIVSWGSEDCDTYGGYTRVSSFLSWINDNTDGMLDALPEEPSGDRVVCPEATTTTYTTSQGESSSFEWKLEPVEAGVLQASGDSVAITWTPDYFGQLVLSVRANVDGEFTSWVSCGITKQEEVSIQDVSFVESVCEGEDLTFSVAIIGDALYFDWYKDSVKIFTGDTSLYLFSLDTFDTGYYWCEVNGQCNIALSEPFYLDVYPTTTIDSVSEDIKVASGNAANIDIFSVGHETSVQWYKDDELIVGEIYSRLELASVNATDIGLYNAVVNGSCGVDTSEYTYLYVDNADTEDADLDVMVWPSVVIDELNVAISNNQKFNLTLFNSVGKRILERKYVDTQTAINMHGLSSGVYFVHVFTHESLEVIRIVKK